jgi:hypothetical protein
MPFSLTVLYYVVSSDSFTHFFAPFFGLDFYYSSLQFMTEAVDPYTTITTTNTTATIQNIDQLFSEEEYCIEDSSTCGDEDNNNNNNWWNNILNSNSDNNVNKNNNENHDNFFTEFFKTGKLIDFSSWHRMFTVNNQGNDDDDDDDDDNGLLGIISCSSTWLDKHFNICCHQ